MDKREFQQLIAAVANELPKDWRFDQRSVAEDIGHARAFIIGPRAIGSKRWGQEIPGINFSPL